MKQRTTFSRSTEGALEWSPQQLSATEAVERWLASGEEQVFRLFGFAGTGKTTLAKHLADRVDGKVLFGAYTGKAALVLRRKGCHGATTIHKMIYRPRDKSKARLEQLQKELTELENSIAPPDAEHLTQLRADIRAEEENLKRPAFTLDLGSEARDADLIVIDEVSMVGSQMGQDLLSFDRPVLVLGDPAQLPPVGDGGYFTGARPDYMLEEVHRQAAGSPVLRMATAVRAGEVLEHGSYGEGCELVRKGTYDLEELARADQVLVGRNSTRRNINRRIREEHFGYRGHLPVAGDRLVCLRNNHDLGLLNGGIWNVLSCDEMSEDRIFLTLQDEDTERIVDAETHRHHFEGRELPWFEKREAEEFDFGYALTVHKAQGSQWDDVIVVDESFCFREHRLRWLYTAVTRAAKRIRVIR